MHGGGSCRIFGGAKLEKIDKLSKVSFADIAGIDQVKSEIREVVAFLRNPQFFLKNGARWPAGILLVGPPGTGEPLRDFPSVAVSPTSPSSSSHACEGGACVLARVCGVVVPPPPRGFGGRQTVL